MKINGTLEKGSPLWSFQKLLEFINSGMQTGRKAGFGNYRLDGSTSLYRGHLHLFNLLEVFFGFCLFSLVELFKKCSLL